MNHDEAAGENGGREILTEKQCRVLDLLIENKTSKEIARALGISPHTVDQRILLARGKLGVSSRTELAAFYREMRKSPDQAPAERLDCSDGKQAEAVPRNDMSILSVPEPSDEDVKYQATPQGDGQIASAAAGERRIPFPTAARIDHRVGPEVFEGKSSMLWRSVAIVATALLLVITILGMLAIYDQLNDMLA